MTLWSKYKELSARNYSVCWIFRLRRPLAVTLGAPPYLVHGIFCAQSVIYPPRVALLQRCRHILPKFYLLLQLWVDIPLRSKFFRCVCGSTVVTYILRVIVSPLRWPPFWVWRFLCFPPQSIALHSVESVEENQFHVGKALLFIVRHTNLWKPICRSVVSCREKKGREDYCIDVFKMRWSFYLYKYSCYTWVGRLANYFLTA